MKIDKEKKLKEEIDSLKYEIWAREEEAALLEKHIIFVESKNAMLQNLISEKLKHAKVKIVEKELREVIKDYNNWLLGHGDFNE